MAQKTIIVFYDAKCVLCDRSIHWLIKNDFEGVFRFSHVSSAFAKNQEVPISTEEISVLTMEGNHLKSSEAALYLLQKTNRYPLIFMFLKFIPLKMLNGFYKIIAAKRYQWFVNYPDCKIPDERIKSKFLDF